MVIKRITKIFVIVSTIVLSILSLSASFVIAASSNIAFASMRIFDIANNEWDLNFRDLAKQGFRMKYSSFKNVAAKLQQTKIRPATAVLYPGAEILTYTNKKALEKFHQEIDNQFDKFLESTAMANKACLLIFDSLDIHRVDKFINENKKDNKLILTIMVYYLDSNSVGIKYVPITKDSFDNYIQLKAEMHQAITMALEEALVNTSGLIQNDNSNYETSTHSDDNIDNSKENEKEKMLDLSQPQYKGSSSENDFWD